MYRDNARGRGVIFDLTYGSHRDQKFPSDALATDDIIVVIRCQECKENDIYSCLSWLLDCSLKAKMVALVDKFTLLIHHGEVIDCPRGNSCINYVAIGNWARQTGYNKTS